MLRYPEEVRFPVENPMVEIPDPPTFDLPIGQYTVFNPTGTEYADRLKEYIHHRNWYSRLMSIINAEKACQAYMFETSLEYEAHLQCRASGSFAPVRYIKD